MAPVADIVTPREGRTPIFAGDGTRPYDQPVDPNSARQVLRIFPDAPLTVELVERAYAGESWARHPSRYQDAEHRARAAEWAQTLASARDVLLREARATPSATAARKRLSTGAIIGIAAGAVAVLALVAVAIFGAASLVTHFASNAEDAIESATGGGDGLDESEIDDVERYESSETFYTFPAALEVYNDGRLDAECPSDYLEGCWQTALFTDESCDTMQVELAFSDSPTDPAPEHVETVEKHDVEAGEAVDVVFGHDEYDYGWINEVTCLDAAS